MIEKEAANDEERATIASVIYNRLAAGWPLQIDATSLYTHPDHEGAPTDEMLADASDPYNTRINTGLPPQSHLLPGHELHQRRLQARQYQLLISTPWIPPPASTASLPTSRSSTALSLPRTTNKRCVRPPGQAAPFSGPAWPGFFTIGLFGQLTFFCFKDTINWIARCARPAHEEDLIAMKKYGLNQLREMFLPFLRPRAICACPAFP